jgi:hypothetical protein
MSSFHSQADILGLGIEVRKVPAADIRVLQPMGIQAFRLDLPSNASMKHCR